MLTVAYCCCMHTQAILQTRVGSRPRFVGPGQRLLTLCTLSLVVMHWYACGMWLIGERQAAAGRGTWVSQVRGKFSQSACPSASQPV
jgi:hypothetical protein